jgi:hypothetical protein
VNLEFQTDRECEERSALNNKEILEPSTSSIDVKLTPLDECLGTSPDADVTEASPEHDSVHEPVALPKPEEAAHLRRGDKGSQGSP